jgi:hypothetical protein
MWMKKLLPGKALPSVLVVFPTSHQVDAGEASIRWRLSESRSTKCNYTARRRLASLLEIDAPRQVIVLPYLEAFIVDQIIRYQMAAVIIFRAFDSS